MELVDALDFRAHAQIDSFLFEFALEKADTAGGLAPRCVSIVQFLYEHQDDPGPNHGPLVVEILEWLFEGRFEPPNAWAEPPDPEDLFPGLIRALSRDGFVVVDGVLRASVPDELNPPALDDELSHALEYLGWTTTAEHLAQARAAHARGDWAAANAQLRTFIESLFDDAFEKLTRKSRASVPKSHDRRAALSEITPPLFSAALNEWDSQGNGFVQGLWKRLHAAGSHPGLSDAEDSTFRLHLCLVVASYFVRRIQRMV